MAPPGFIWRISNKGTSYESTMSLRRAFGATKQSPCWRKAAFSGFLDPKNTGVLTLLAET